MQLAFVLAKRSPVHLEAANGVYPVKIFIFVCLTYDKKNFEDDNFKDALVDHRLQDQSSLRLVKVLTGEFMLKTYAASSSLFTDN